MGLLGHLYEGDMLLEIRLVHSNENREHETRNNSLQFLLVSLLRDCKLAVIECLSAERIESRWRLPKPRNEWTLFAASVQKGTRATFPILGFWRATRLALSCQNNACSAKLRPQSCRVAFPPMHSERLASPLMFILKLALGCNLGQKSIGQQSAMKQAAKSPHGEVI